MPRLAPLLLPLLAVVIAASACAQTTPADADAIADSTDAYLESAVLEALTDPSADLTPAEQAVRDVVLEDGVHVVHFWAPWCDNSRAELEAGWYEVVENNPDVSFTFVTIWNDGEAGQDVLDRFAIPASVTVLTQDDYGPSDEKANRRRRFLGLPVTWIPTTWVFRDNGELAYAFNYGEVAMDQLQQALDGAHSEWSHD
jgi:thiol-disulfide isomerase/thioredoxin